MSLIKFTNEESPRLFTLAKRNYELRMKKSISNSEFLEILVQNMSVDEVELSPQDKAQYRLLECESQINDLYDKYERMMSMISRLHKR